MTPQTQTQNRSETTERNSSASTVLGFAIIGLLVAGAVGALTAMSMESGFDVLLCLLGATGAFGMALCAYFWKR